MEYPKDQIELENLVHQCQDEGDERATMLGLFSVTMAEEAERLRLALKALVDDTRNMLDRIEAWPDAMWIKDSAIKQLRSSVNFLLHGIDEDLGVSMHEKAANEVVINFKSHFAARMNAYALKDTLRKPDGTFWNFIEMKLTDREIGELLLTLQRRSGETPKDQINKLKEQVKDLEERLKNALSSSEDERHG